MPSAGRAALLERLCGEVPAARSGPSALPVLVAVDGVDGSGKSTFADGLVSDLRRQGREVALIRVDDFLNPREVRYRLGRHSPEGFWQDSYDYSSLIAEIHGIRAGMVGVIEGMFLHRDGLAHRWDYSLYLDVPFAMTAARMAVRDGTPADPDHPGMARYVDGQRMYFKACEPWARATRIIDNSDVRRPEIRLLSEVTAVSDR